MSSYTVQAAMLIVFLLLVAVLVVYVAFVLWKSRASIQQRNLRLKGPFAALIILFVLLIQFLPDVRSLIVEDAVPQPVTVEIASGTELTVEVSLSPATQFITTKELRRLDRNKYDIHEVLGLAMPRVSSDTWNVGEIRDVDVIGLADLPFIAAGLELKQVLFDMNKPAIFGLQQRKVKSLLLGKKSAVDGTPVTTNFFENKDYVSAMAKVWLKSSEQMSVDSSEIAKAFYERLIEELRGQAAAQFNAALEKKLPIKKQMRDGVYVIPLSREMLEASFLITAGINHTLLDKALLYLTSSGYVADNSLGNLYMDQRRGIASFNSNVKLTNVEVDGKIIDVMMNTIGFIVTSDDRAIIVLLIHGSTEDIQTFKELEAFFNKLRFAA